MKFILSIIFNLLPFFIYCQSIPLSGTIGDRETEPVKNFV